MPEKATDVAVATPLLSDAQYGEIKSFDDAMALLAQAGIPTTSITEYGDGFEVMPKSAFVNVKFILLDYKVIPADKSDYNSDFAVVRIVTADGRKALLTDGGTGLCEQVKILRDKGVLSGVMCEKGLVVSEYDYVDDKGEKTKASTYYFAGM